MSDPLSALRDQALRETLRTVYADKSVWMRRDGRTREGRQQRATEREGYVRTGNRGVEHFFLTMKGREFINAG